MQENTQNSTNNQRNGNPAPPDGAPSVGLATGEGASSADDDTEEGPAADGLHGDMGSCSRMGLRAKHGGASITHQYPVMFVGRSEGPEGGLGGGSIVDDDGGVSDEEQTRLFVRSFEHVLRSRETDEMS